MKTMKRTLVAALDLVSAVVLLPGYAVSKLRGSEFARTYEACCATGWRRAPGSRALGKALVGLADLFFGLVLLPLYLVSWLLPDAGTKFATDYEACVKFSWKRLWA